MWQPAKWHERSGIPPGSWNKIIDTVGRLPRAGQVAGQANPDQAPDIIWLAFNTHLISVEEYPDRKERAQNPAERFIHSQSLHALLQIHQRVRDFLKVTKTGPRLPRRPIDHCTDHTHVHRCT